MFAFFGLLICLYKHVSERSGDLSHGRQIYNLSICESFIERVGSRISYILFLQSLHIWHSESCNAASILALNS